MNFEEMRQIAKNNQDMKEPPFFYEVLKQIDLRLPTKYLINLKKNLETLEFIMFNPSLKENENIKHINSYYDPFNNKILINRDLPNNIFKAYLTHELIHAAGTYYDQKNDILYDGIIKKENASTTYDKYDFDTGMNEAIINYITLNKIHIVVDNKERAKYDYLRDPASRLFREKQLEKEHNIEFLKGSIFIPLYFSMKQLDLVIGEQAILEDYFVNHAPNNINERIYNYTNVYSNGFSFINGINIQFAHNFKANLFKPNNLVDTQKITLIGLVNRLNELPDYERVELIKKYEQYLMNDHNFNKFIGGPDIYGDFEELNNAFYEIKDDVLGKGCNYESR